MVHARYGIYYTKLMQNYPLRTAHYGDLTYLDKQVAESAAKLMREQHPDWQVQLIEFMAEFEVPAEVVPFSWVRKQ